MDVINNITILTRVNIRLKKTWKKEILSEQVKKEKKQMTLKLYNKLILLTLNIDFLKLLQKPIGLEIEHQKVRVNSLEVSIKEL